MFISLQFYRSNAQEGLTCFCTLCHKQYKLKCLSNWALTWKPGWKYTSKFIQIVARIQCLVVGLKSHFSSWLSTIGSSQLLETHLYYFSHVCLLTCLLLTCLPSSLIQDRESNPSHILCICDLPFYGKPEKTLHLKCLCE